jgi:anti-anti-sigma factor
MVVEPVDDEGDVLVVLRGELAGPAAYALDTQLRRVEDAGPRSLVLDMASLDFIDSAGLARLLAAQRRARRAGRRLIVIPGTGAVRRLLTLTALDHHLELFPDAAAAAAAVSAHASGA